MSQQTQTTLDQDPAQPGIGTASTLVDQQESAEVRSPVTDEPLEGTQIGNYILRKKLGEGGMGVVYGAFDTKLDRKVALKLLKDEADPKARKRFLREAQAMARLSHPNIVQVYDIDEIDGAAIIVMEYVRGEDLKQWLAAEFRSEQEILDVFEAAAAGLEAAHNRGLVHRDFKPANVMINEDGRVLVMDFGLAREWGRDRSSTHKLRAGALLDQMTTAGTLLGTPAYMSPEQFDGIATNAHTDQFSFCVALWEALYGERPFKAETMLQLACAVKTEDFHLPANPRNISLWKQSVLVQGLSMDPEERWPSMSALMEALKTEPEDQTDARTASTTRRWLLWLGLGAGLVIVVAALVIALRRG